VRSVPCGVNVVTIRSSKAFNEPSPRFRQEPAPGGGALEIARADLSRLSHKGYSFKVLMIIQSPGHMSTSHHMLLNVFVSMPRRSFSPGLTADGLSDGTDYQGFNALTAIESRDRHSVDDIHIKREEFQCLDGHSVPGLLTLLIVSLTLVVLVGRSQCLDGHSVPGLLHGRLVGLPAPRVLMP